jgi:Tol biopolymer transport system component
VILTLKRIAVAGTVSLWVASPVARAAFPGRNGELAWSFSHGISCESGGCRGTIEIKAIGVTGGDRRVLACDAFHPRYSPDGRRLAFQRPGVGIFTKTVDEPSRAELVPGSQNSYAATWAPDGNRLAFHAFRSRRSTRADIYISGGNGNARRRVTADGRSFSPVWGPDGRIAFGWEGKRPGVFVVKPDGSERRRVTVAPRKHPPDNPTAGTLEFPESWSPDGKRIAFVRTRLDERNRIYVVDADGGRLHRVAAGAAFAAWAPNGKRIAIAPRGFSRRIDTVRPDGSDRRPLAAEPLQGSVRCHNDQAPNPPEGIGFSGLDWQPLPPGR